METPVQPRPRAGATGDGLADLYVRERHALVRFGFLLTGDLAAAEDLVQEAFAALAPRMAGLAEPDRALGYVRVSMLNASRRRGVRDAGRERRHLRMIDPDVPSPDEDFVLAEEHRRVARIVQHLPPRQRAVVALRYWSDLSEAEIASALGISAGTVKSTAHRALRAIAATLAEEENT